MRQCWLLLPVLWVGACAHLGGDTAAAATPYYDDEVPPPAIRIVPEEARLATGPGVRTIEVEFDTLGEESSVVAQPEREPIGGFKLCGKSCAQDPRWTEGGKKLPDEH